MGSKSVSYGFTIKHREKYNKRLIVDSFGLMARQLGNGWQSFDLKHRRRNIKKTDQSTKQRHYCTVNDCEKWWY